jgi:MFS family permease
VSSKLPFYALVSAYGVSVLGTAMSALAIPWLVLSTTGSAGRTGIVGFAEMAPYVLLQATAGPLVDRIGAKRGSVAGNAVATIAVGAIPALYAAGTLHFALLIGLVAVGGGVRGLADTATGPLVPATAKIGAIPFERAAGLYSGASRTGLLVGAPLAGVVVAAANAPVAVLVDGMSFGAAAIVIAVFVPALQRPEMRSAGGLTASDYLTSLGEGLRFIRADRLLLGLVTLIAVTNLLDQALMSVLIPVWVRDRLHDPTALGFLGGVSNVGALLGVLGAAWLGPRLPRRVAFVAGFLLGGAPAFFALALFSGLPPVLVITGLAGLIGGVINPVIGAIQYERVPEELQARVLGAVKASAWVGIPFGSLLGGAITAEVGLTATLWIAGGCMLMATLAPTVFPAWRDVGPPVAAPA